MEPDTSELINDFLQSEHLDLDNRLVKGVSLTPAFIIEPTDEEYENSENLFGFDEAEFYEKIKFTSFEDRISVIDVLK